MKKSFIFFLLLFTSVYSQYQHQYKGYMGNQNYYNAHDDQHKENENYYETADNSRSVGYTSGSLNPRLSSGSSSVKTEEERPLEFNIADFPSDIEANQNSPHGFHNKGGGQFGSQLDGQLGGQDYRRQMKGLNVGGQQSQTSFNSNSHNKNTNEAINEVNKSMVII